MFGFVSTTICSVSGLYPDGEGNDRMIESFIVFTAEHCPGCGPVKEFLKGTSLSGRVMDIAESEASEEAVKFAVRSLPTVIFLDQERNEVARAHNVSDVKSIIRGD